MGVLTELASSGKLVDLPGSRELVLRGRLFVVVDGLVCVEHRARVGRTILGLVGRDDVFFCVAQEVFVRSVHSGSPAKIAVIHPVRLPQRLLIRAYERDLRALSFRVCVARLPGKQRLATVLAYLGTLVGTRRTSNVVELPRISHLVLAGYSGFTRETVTVKLGELVADGTVVRSDTGFLVRTNSPRVWGPDVTGRYFWESMR